MISRRVAVIRKDAAQYQTDAVLHSPARGLQSGEVKMTDDDYDEDRDDSPYCDCGAVPTTEELDWNRCSACGKRLEP